MQYYKILDSKSRVVMMNCTDLKVSFEFISQRLPNINTRLLYLSGDIALENKVNGHWRLIVFYLSAQDGHSNELVHPDYRDDIRDGLAKNYNSQLVEVDVEEEMDKTFISTTSDEVEIIEEEIETPQLMKLDVKDLNIVLITKSGNVIATVGNSQRLLISKQLFNKLCLNKEWCAIGEIYIDGKEVMALKGLSFNC